MKFETIWKKYQVSEIGITSLFSKMERIKLAFDLLNSLLNISFLVQKFKIN